MSDTYRATANNQNLSPDGPNGETLSKDFSREHKHDLHDDMAPGEALKRVQTSGSLSISPELFEKIYLSPQNKVAGQLRKTVANPTPVALVGFLISLTPLSCDLMGWRGAGGSGAASTGVFFFFGGLLMILGAVGEFIIGNTFPACVFASFSAFWLGYASTLVPYFNAWGAYSTTDNPADGLATVGFRASLAFWLLWMGVLCFVYLLCALRTNLVFCGIFFGLVLAFGFLAGAYWQLAQGSVELAGNLTVGGGACAFFVCCCGWYLFTAILLASVDAPLNLPVGDLSRYVPSATDRAKAKSERQYDA